MLLHIQNATLYQGTPRDMLDLSMIDSGHLKEMNGSFLELKMYSHRKLIRIENLILENAIYGR